MPMCSARPNHTLSPFARSRQKHLFYDICFVPVSMQINLPSEIRTALLDVVEDPAAEHINFDVFEASRREIFRLMKRDSFVRFSTSFTHQELFPQIVVHQASFSTCV